jgi:uncharacterized protein YndB with AHSA1/START domain
MNLPAGRYCELQHRMRIESTTEIAQPPRRVWDFIADARNDPRWCSKVDSVHQLEGQGPGPGARFQVLHRPKPLGGPVELTMDVIEFDPPRRLRWREEDDDAVFHVVYELEQQAGGTRLTQIDEIDWKISRLLLPVGRLMVQRDLRRQLAALKRLLEGDA